MSKRILLLLVGVLAMGLIAAGCGDDDDNGDDTTSIEATVEEETTPEDTDAEETDVPDDVDAAVQQAVEACKESVAAAPQISADAKADLEALCDEAASGDVEDVQAAAQEVCVTIVEETVPEGAARDQALDACESATAAP